MKTHEEGYALGWADAIYAYESKQRKNMSTVDDLMALVENYVTDAWSVQKHAELEAAIESALRAEYERGRLSLTALGSVAEREQDVEPVLSRWMWKDSDESQTWRYTEPPIWKDKNPSKLIVQRLYASPPKRKPLTLEQAKILVHDVDATMPGTAIGRENRCIDLVRLAERAHGIGDE